tara:strand:+ start:662 stop:907 length:246 start_codon:yes stop_codon:yes gene_type:complete
MSSELYKYIETRINKKENLLRAKVINFPNEIKFNETKNLKTNVNNHWRIDDKNNIDQLKAVIGICFVIGILTVVGLYSNLM